MCLTDPQGKALTCASVRIHQKQSVWPLGAGVNRQRPRAVWKQWHRGLRIVPITSVSNEPQRGRRRKVLNSSPGDKVNGCLLIRQWPTDFTPYRRPAGSWRRRAVDDRQCEGGPQKNASHPSQPRTAKHPSRIPADQSDNSESHGDDDRYERGDGYTIPHEAGQGSWKESHEHTDDDLPDRLRYSLDRRVGLRFRVAVLTSWVQRRPLSHNHPAQPGVHRDVIGDWRNVARGKRMPRQSDSQVIVRTRQREHTTRPGHDGTVARGEPCRVDAGGVCRPPSAMISSIAPHPWIDDAPPCTIAPLEGRGSGGARC